MTPHTLTSRSVALLVLALTACGDDGGTSATSGQTSSGTTEPTAPTTSASTPSTPTTEPTTSDEPTVGSNSNSESATDITTSTTAATTGTSTSEPTATDTMQVSTETDPDPSTTTSTTNPDETTGTSTGDTSTGDDTSTGEDTTTGNAICECPDLEVPLDDGIFVLSDDAELWKFFPEDNHFEMLGNFNCGGMTNTFSMAVDRLGFAWVMFNSPAGEIRKISVNDPANCMDPGYNPNQMGVGYFGMAFVSESAENPCDQLHGNTYDGIGGFAEGNNIGDFIRVDPDTLLVSKLGKTNFNGAEVTGTGDGRAFLFGGVNPSKLVEVDKTNGQFLDVLPLGNLELTNAFAFAFFAGDFYFFTEEDGFFPDASKVTHLDYDNSEGQGVVLTTVVPSGPIRIVGAGVSTCAPFAPQ